MNPLSAYPEEVSEGEEVVTSVLYALMKLPLLDILTAVFLAKHSPLGCLGWVRENDVDLVVGASQPAKDSSPDGPATAVSRKKTMSGFCRHRLKLQGILSGG